MTGSSRPIMRFRCWKIILECCRWRDLGWPGARRPRRRRERFSITCVRRSAGSLDHVDRIGWYERQNCLVLDAVTVRNLELIEPLFAGTDAGVTLFRSIDAAVTPMGKRLLRAWLLRPSLDLGEINARLDAVEAGVKDTVAREELRRALDGVLDLERLLSRVTLETANPRDVLALAASLAKIPAIKAAVGRLPAERLKTLHRIARRIGRSARAHRQDDCAGAASEFCRWRRDCRGRRSRSRRTARTLAQQQAGAGADRAAGTRAHRNLVRSR